MIRQSGSTLDYLAFVTSSLHSKVETKYFLAPTLVIYSNNTYVSNNYIGTPCKNVSLSSKDTCNFYYS